MKSAVIIVHGIGPIDRYQIQDQFAGELRDALNTETDDERRQRFGVYFIFKSPEQRGDNRPDSDVDFLVDMGPGRTRFDLSGLVLDLERLLGASVDGVTEASPALSHPLSGVLQGGSIVNLTPENAEVR